MLVNCPECKLQVSDKASFCPHCGFPFTNAAKRTYRKRTHKRLPNGFGQISKINKPLAKPYRAMITVGKDDSGRPIVKPLKPTAYFATYNEAYEALVKYNKDRSIAPTITVSELFNRWSSEAFEDVTPGTAKTYRLAYRYCTKYHNENITNVGITQIRELMDLAPLSLKARVLYLFAQMYDYAVGYGYLDKNVARLIKLPRAVTKEIESEKREHLSFSKDEVDELWKYTDDPWVSILIIHCYMGWRPQELVNITTFDVNLDEMTITGGIKTEAGRNRIVPIHPKIQKLVLEKYNNAEDGKLFPVSYQTYYRRFKETIEKYNLNTSHRPHDPRKTFVTMAKDAGVNEYAIKRIIGHSIVDLTEKVYTERPISWLMDEISKI